MLINVLKPDMWDKLNEEVRKSLSNVHPSYGLRVYQGIGHAVYEIAMGTLRFMSHKKFLGVVTGQSEVIEKNLPHFYKEGCEVSIRLHTDLSNANEWVDSLAKDTCFVIFAEDHPVTGELYPFADVLDELLNKKRIYSLRVSYAQHYYSSIELRPYSVRMCAFDEGVAVALLGERFRSPVVVADELYWDRVDYIQKLTGSRENRLQDQDLILDFEKEIATIAKTYFTVESNRIFDRSVIYFEDVSAEALGSLLLKKMGIPEDIGWQKIATTNMCKWGESSGLNIFSKWWLPKPSAEKLRGILIINIEMLKVKDFAKLLISSYEEIKQQQSWSL